MDRKGTQMYLSFLPGAEAVSKCQAMNRRVGTDPKTMLGRPLSLRLCLYRQLYLRKYDTERDKYDTELFLLSWRFQRTV